MATWYYYNEQGEKIATTGGRLKGLAKAGVITSETIVETEDGKKARAGKVKGLTFGTTAPSNETETYGLSQPKPPPEPSPFTASLSETENPFSAPMPVVAKSADNPFTNPMPATNQAEPQRVAAAVVDGDKRITEESTDPTSVLVPILLIPVALFILIWVVMAIGDSISNSGGGSFSGGGGGREAEARFKREQMEADHRNDMRVQDIQRESQARQARIRVNAEIEKKRFEHTLQLDRMRLTANKADIEGQRQILEMELQQFRNRKEMEFLTTYGVPFDLEKAARERAVAEQEARERVARAEAAKKVLTAAERAQFTAQEQAEIERFCTYNGSDIKAVNNYGDTLLYKAISGLHGTPAVAKFLISRGADVHARDRHDNTPLHRAVFWNKIEIAQLLVFAGADVHAKDKDGNSPLHMAANRINAQLLVSAGADIHARNNRGSTPLHIVAMRGHVEVAKFLISQGADVNAKFGSSGTPLRSARFAATQGTDRSAMIEYLQSVGARSEL